MARSSQRINKGGDAVKNLQNGPSKSTHPEENGTSDKPDESEAEAPSTPKKDTSEEIISSLITKQDYEMNGVVKKKEIDPDEDAQTMNFITREEEA